MGIPTLTRSWNRSVPYPQMTGRWLLRAAGIVFMELIACGFLTLNSSAGRGSEGSLTNLSRSQPVELPNNEDEIQQRIPIVPKFVPADLPSPDPKARLGTLDHWDKTNTAVPLSAVVEAMKDEDQAMRARTTAIIEQQWAIEQYVMDLTFSMTRSDCGELITKSHEEQPWHVMAEQKLMCRVE